MNDTATTPVDVDINAVGAVMGGAARHLPHFLQALTEVRPTWRLHVWVSEGVSTDGWPGGVRHDSVPRMSPLGRLRWETIALPRLLRVTRPDVLVNLTNSGPLLCPVPSVLYQRNALWFDPRWVATLHGSAALEAGARRLLTFVQARTASSVIVPSGAMAGYLDRWPLWPRTTPLRVVPHAVDPERFPFTPRPWPPPVDRSLQILAVGHAAPHKDQRLLIELVRQLTDRGRDVNLILTVADDDDAVYVQGLRQLARSRSVQDRIQFLGTVDDPARLYASADVALSASITESFGFPVVEAMAAGLPVVASRIGASTELAGRSAWFFDPGNPTSAADAVDELLRSPATVIAQRVESGHTTASRLTWSRNAESVAAVIEASIDDGSRRAC